MKRSRPEKATLIDPTLASPRRVAVPVLIRNGRPCHQTRFPLPSSSSSSSSSNSSASTAAAAAVAAAVANQHIHGQSNPSNSNSSLVLSSCKTDTPPSMIYPERQAMKYDNMDLFQQFLLSQWALSKKFFFPTTTWLFSRFFVAKTVASFIFYECSFFFELTYLHTHNSIYLLSIEPNK